MKCIYQRNPDLGTWFHATFTRHGIGSVHIQPVNENYNAVVRSEVSPTFKVVLEIQDRKVPTVGDLVCVVDVKHLRGLDSDVRLGDLLKVVEVVAEGVRLQYEDGIFPFSSVQAY